MKKKCSYQNHKTPVGKIWHFLAHEDSWISFIVDAILVIVLGKYLILPVIGLLLGTQFPMVAVVSGSMDHNNMDFDTWWEQNKGWYVANDITKEQFSEFDFNEGFKKGDVFVIVGSPYDQLKAGDVIVYAAPGKSDPIIHRITSINNTIVETKGDANPMQIDFETRIQPRQVFGKAKVRVPFIGWVKVSLVDLLNLAK